MAEFRKVVNYPPPKGSGFPQPNRIYEDSSFYHIYLLKFWDLLNRRTHLFEPICLIV